MQVFGEIVVEQDALAERVGQQILAADAQPDPGQFLMEFTDTHDLGIDYLIQKAIGCQRQDVAELQRCAERLNLAPASRTLAIEAVAMAKKHLQSLEELASTDARA